MNESFAEYTDFLPQCGSKHFSEVRFFPASVRTEKQAQILTVY